MSQKSIQCSSVVGDLEPSSFEKRVPADPSNFACGHYMHLAWLQSSWDCLLCIQEELEKLSLESTRIGVREGEHYLLLSRTAASFFKEVQKADTADKLCRETLPCNCPSHCGCSEPEKQVKHQPLLICMVLDCLGLEAVRGICYHEWRWCRLKGK